ncbi:MAG TPA: hypothetical protein VJU80_00500 [Solirubrobacteraceae bacterium]|nr:hypothetical protein [Solirubrobacteraceae bacterium]
MNPVSHQTIRLSTGMHSSPDHGACVIELASMLAGEPFSDRPRSVCPVIAAVLRRYNDVLDDRRRQELYPYAARVVGSRGPARLEHARVEYLSGRTTERFGRRHRWRRLFGFESPSVDALAARAVHELSRRGEDSHALVLGLVDELLALDTRRGVRVPDTLPVAPSPRAINSRPKNATDDCSRGPGR